MFPSSLCALSNSLRVHPFEGEVVAVADLLQYLESAYYCKPSNILITTYLYKFQRPDDDQLFYGSPLSALSTLSYSDNVEVQRGAALAFTEITEKEDRPVGCNTLDPILSSFLLSGHDTEVQQPASAALSNLAMNGGLKLSLSSPQLATQD